MLHDELFQRLWSKAVDAPGYVESEWRALEVAVDYALTRGVKLPDPSPYCISCEQHLDVGTDPRDYDWLRDGSRWKCQRCHQLEIAVALASAVKAPKESQQTRLHKAVVRAAAEAYTYQAARPGEFGPGYFYIETGNITLLSQDGKTWVKSDVVPGQLINIYDCFSKYVKVKLDGGWKLFEQTTDGIRVQSFPEGEDEEGWA